MKKLNLVAGTVVLGLVACSSQDVFAAGSTTETMEVKVNVAASCQITTNTLDFGTYNPHDTVGLTSSAPFTLRCSDGAAPKVGIEDSLGFDTGTGLRKMRNGDATSNIDYLLYQATSGQPNASCAPAENVGTAVFLGSAEANQLALTGATLEGTTYNICGFIPAKQLKQSGLYTDTVTVSINF